jgi:hypothetical protein
MDSGFQPIFEKCLPYTMTSAERLYSVYKSIEYIVANNIQGDIVECGVWKGGSSMCAMLSLAAFGDQNRNFFLYDTFEGMSEPGEKDKDLSDSSAKDQLSSREKTTSDVIWAYSPLEEVQKNIEYTGYPMSKVQCIKGKVEETIPGTISDKVALLRLDTDWYESTLHELNHLFPKLVPGGVLIIDDYGHWKGAREAVDQYFHDNNITILLNRIDYTGRAGIKC